MTRSISGRSLSFAAAGKQSRRDHLDDVRARLSVRRGFGDARGARAGRSVTRADAGRRTRRTVTSPMSLAASVRVPPASSIRANRTSRSAFIITPRRRHPAHRAIHRFIHPPSSRAGCRCEGRAAQWTELAQARGDRHGRVARAAPLQDGRALRAVHPPEDQRGTSSPRETYSLRSLRVPSRACAETSWNTILAARRKCAVRSLRHTSLDANDRRSQRTIDRLSRPARVDLLFSSVGLTD